MGSLGIGELILLAGIALIVIGPDKFPDFARIVGRTVRDLKGYVNDVKQDISEELKPVRDEVQKLSSHRPEEYFDALTRSDAPKKDHGPQESVDAESVDAESVDAEPQAGTDAECYDLHPGNPRPHAPAPGPGATNDTPADTPPDDDPRD
jgi:Tat protein translocase TatB subunit